MSSLSDGDIFGPVLYAEGEVDGVLHYGVVCAAKSCPDFSCEAALTVSAPAKIVSFEGMSFFRWDIAVRATLATAEVVYTLSGKQFSFYLPSIPADKSGFRIAYASCNGSESDGLQMPPPAAKYAGWEDIAKEHMRHPFTLLIQGGDQIYADRLWQETPALKDWVDSGRNIEHAPVFDAALQEQVRAYYFKLYMQVWSQPFVRKVLASVPSFMIWDDHDIFDGWGSWSEKRQASSLYQGIFNCAREAFCLFQRGRPSLPAGPHLGKAIKMAGSLIVAPDLRSQRTRQQVMGQDAREWFDKTLADATDCKETIIAFSVPLATGHFSALDFILTGFPDWLSKVLPPKINPKKFADDIHDQWRVPAHREEWITMLDKLLAHQAQRGSRVTLLSGEIHMGARSVILDRRRKSITQYIASGISHPPMPRTVVFFCEWLSKGRQELNENLFIKMEKIYPTSRRRYIASRNWLSLWFTPEGDSIATWHTLDGVSVSHARFAQAHGGQQS